MKELVGAGAALVDPAGGEHLSAGGVEREEIVVVTVGDVDDERGFGAQTFNPPHPLPDEWLVAECDNDTPEVETFELDIEANDDDVEEVEQVDDPESFLDLVTN